MYIYVYSIIHYVYILFYGKMYIKARFRTSAHVPSADCSYTSLYCLNEFFP